MTSTLVVINDNLIDSDGGSDTLHLNHHHHQQHQQQQHELNQILNETLNNSSQLTSNSQNKSNLNKSAKKKQHNCPFCDRSFTRPYRLNDHISFSHTDERKYLCLTCSKNFSCKDKLKAHIDVKHDNNRPHHIKKKPRTSVSTSQGHLMVHGVVTINDSKISSQSQIESSLLHEQQQQQQQQQQRQPQSKQQQHQHQVVVHKPLHLKCSYPGCTKIFANKYNVKRHIENVHLKIKKSKSKDGNDDLIKMDCDATLTSTTTTTTTTTTANTNTMNLSGLTDENHLNDVCSSMSASPASLAASSSSSSSTTTTTTTPANGTTLHVKAEDTYMLTSTSDGLVVDIKSSSSMHHHHQYDSTSVSSNEPTSTLQLISGNNFKAVDLNSLLIQCEPKIEVMDIIDHEHNHGSNSHQYTSNQHLFDHDTNSNSNHSDCSNLGIRHQMQQEDDKNPKIYTCARCPEMFNSSNLLRKHVADQHEKEYECCICNMNFNNRFTHLKHKKYHIGKRDEFYDCNSLYKRSIQSKELLQESSVNDVLSCDQCKRCYSNMNKYRIHLKKCQLKQEHEKRVHKLSDEQHFTSNNSRDTEFPRDRLK